MSAVQVVETTAYLGGGALPTQGLPSVAVSVRPGAMTETEFARRLRVGEPHIVARVHGGAVLFELRTVLTDQDDTLADAVGAASQAS